MPKYKRSKSKKENHSDEDKLDDILNDYFKTTNSEFNTVVIIVKKYVFIKKR